MPALQTRPSLRRRLAMPALVVLSCLVLAACWGPQQDRGMVLVNQSRAANRLAAMSGDVAAMQKAQAWSDRMAATGRLEHTGGGNKLDPSGLTGWCSYGENVGYGASVETVQAQFMNSSIHRANILGRFDRVGVGVTVKGNYVWVTQVFLRSC